MNNYQLYRTNLLLGGQMKWDLIISSSQNTLYVSDFHLSPISNNAPYTYKSDEYLINNSHQDNVKAYYAANKGHFYNECLDAEFTHNWPLICHKDEILNIYSNTYDMGCKRIKTYDKYHKQFEFFCPVWVEHLTDDISFKIEIKDTTNNNLLSSNTLTLGVNTVNNKYHNEFIQYFNNYIKDAGIDVGTDDVLNIMFDNNMATITGLNASTGIFETRSINNLIDNITSRERPLMEVDDMLIQSFVNNSILCKQLLNFNLCFNINDIMSGGIVKMINGENVVVSVSVMIGDTVLEKKNFYSEYEYIDKFVTSNKPIDFTKNVLDYLHDDKYIEFIDKNKFNQPICHWSLHDNPDYIFNVYEGFSGLTIEDNLNGGYNIYENEHQYCNAPNTYISKADKQQNSTGWFTCYNVIKWNDFYKYINNVNKYKTQGTFIGGDCHFINNIKYKYIPKKINDMNGIYLIGLSMSNSMLETIHESFECVEIISGLLMLNIDDFVLLLTDNQDNFTFNVFYSILCSYTHLIDSDDSTLTKSIYDSGLDKFFNNDTSAWYACNNYFLNTFVNAFINEMHKMLTSKIEPSLIVFNNSILYTTTNGPSRDISEVEYFKDNASYNYVIRYDGKIKPTFTDNTHTLYYKDYASNDTDSKFKNSIYTQFDHNLYEPLYPSIDYCAIKKYNDWSYTELPKVTVLEHKQPISIYNNEFEYPWFNNSICLIIEPELRFSYTNTKSNGYESLDDIIANYLKIYYNTDDTHLIDVIKQYYTFTNNWEYASDDNIDDYIYNITLKLK